MPALSCREGRFSFFCWHWRSRRGDRGMLNFTVVFVRCEFGSALLGFANFSFPPSSQHSAEGHRAALLERVTVEKNVYLQRTGLRMYISLYEKLCYASTSMEALEFWAFLFGYQATHILENQIHVLWGKFQHPESLWKSEISWPCFCAVVEQKREEIKPVLNLLNKCISCTCAIRKQRLFLSGWHGADWFLQPHLFRFAPTVFCPKRVFRNSESYYATSSAATQAAAAVGSKELMRHLYKSKDLYL